VTALDLPGRGLTARAALAVACAFLAAPAAMTLIKSTLGSGIPGVDLTGFVSGLVYAVCAIGAYRGWQRIHRIIGIYALLLSVFAVLFTVATGPGLFGLVSLFRPPDPAGLAGGGSAFVQTLFKHVWLNVGFAWMVTLLAHRVNRSAKPACAEASRREKRTIHWGIGLVCVWALISPLVMGAVAPIRTLAPGILLATPDSAQIVLSEAQKRALSPQSLATIDEINQGLKQILNGQPTPLLQAPERYGETTFYKAISGHYRFNVFRKKDRIRQVDFRINYDLHPDLRKLSLADSFVLY
jgi:hypothetical protein